jgi:hypothetical protein
MALIDCSECGKQISDKAASCIHCGNPRTVAAAPEAVAIESAPVITTQETGKAHKVVQLIGGAIVVLGVVSCVASETPNAIAGMLISGIGAVIFLAGRFSAWWAHG